MADMTFNREELEAWLKTQPREVPTIIAARAALRVLPLLSNAVESRVDAASAVVLPSFRAAALPWTASSLAADSSKLLGSKASSSSVRFVTYAALSDDNLVVASARAAALVADSPDAVFVLAINAAAAAFFADDALIADVPIAKATRAAVVDATKTAVAASDGVLSDREHIEAGGSAASLAVKPLWHAEPVPKELASSWNRLRTQLLKRDEGWDVWSDWYDARLQGSPANVDLEVARVTLPENLWDQGPAAVNARIRELIDKHELKNIAAEAKDLEQRPAPYGFSWKNGRIEAEPMREAPLDLSIAEDILDELRQKGAAALAGLTGNHADPRLIETVSSFLECIQGAASEIHEGRLLMRFRVLEADAGAFVDPSSDRERDIRSIVSDFAASAEDLISLYPALRTMEANRLALRFKSDETTQKTFQQTVEELTEIAEASTLVGASAIEALKEGTVEQASLTEIIDGTGDERSRAEALEKRAMISGLQALDVRNFVSSGLKKCGDELGPVLSESWNEAKGAIPRGVGKGVEGAVSGSVKLGVAALVASFAGPVAGLGLLIASFAPLGKRAEKVKEAVEDQKDDPADDDELVDT